MGERSCLLEVCVDNVLSIKNAIKGGAERIELCQALSEGGLTPSIGLAKLAKRISPIPVFAMIRIRGGNYIYSYEELVAMCIDIENLKTIGIDGFVFGALTPEGLVDVECCQKIIDVAKPLPVTFHRAYDDTVDPFATLDQIIQLGFTRILTSGHTQNAVDGIELIADITKRAKDAIIIMPGAGLNQFNIEKVKKETGAKEFHGSAKKIRDKNSEISISGIGDTVVTDPEIVKSMVTILKNQ